MPIQRTVTKIWSDKTLRIATTDDQETLGIDTDKEEGKGDLTRFMTDEVYEGTRQ